MNNQDGLDKVDTENNKDSAPDSLSTEETPEQVTDAPRENGGRGGLDPTRYGDWEKAGRCIDF